MVMVDDEISSTSGWVTLAIDDNTGMVVYNNTENSEVRYRIGDSTSIGVLLKFGEEISVDTDVDVKVSPKYRGLEGKAIVTRLLIDN